tara:strand:- start:5262 stop:5753 length:492 start_codon:yes stop_codon:yes gene_type:complete
MAGCSLTMSPVSVFAQTAVRRSVRRLAAAASHAARGPERAFAGASPTTFLSHHSHAGHSRVPVAPLRRGVSATARAILDAVPVPEKGEPAAQKPSSSDEDEYKWAPRDPKVHSLEGSLVILEGVGGDVKPGTLFDIGENGTTAVLLSHREPKTFALMFDASGT